MNRLVRGRTTLIVAHRLSTIRNANRIVVMHNGKCAECGPPAQLLENHGAFFRLKEMQV